MMKPGGCCFTVRGSGQFPFDMLRYDSCWPAQPEDAANLQCGNTLEGIRCVRTVRLCTKQSWAPTRSRWESFNWEVLPEEQ